MIRKSSSGIAPDDIGALEVKLAVTIPAEVRSHYLDHNGGVPDPNCWVIDDYAWHCIQAFLPMKHGERTVESVYLKGLEKGYLAPGLVPFANDPGGNYFCFDQAGQVFFYATDAWRPELSDTENRARATKRLAGSFQEFVANLKRNPEEE